MISRVWLIKKLASLLLDTGIVCYSWQQQKDEIMSRVGGREVSTMLDAIGNVRKN